MLTHPVESLYARFVSDLHGMLAKSVDTTERDMIAGMIDALATDGATWSVYTEMTKGIRLMEIEAKERDRDDEWRALGHGPRETAA